MRVLRYCASSNTIPKGVPDKDITVLFGLDRNGQQSTYNSRTKMCFGFSYWIDTEKDPSPKVRKFELDIKYTTKEFQRQFTMSYHTFTKRYDDENFDGCQHEDPLRYNYDEDDFSKSSYSSDKSFVPRDYEYEEFIEREQAESLGDLQDELANVDIEENEDEVEEGDDEIAVDE